VGNVFALRQRTVRTDVGAIAHDLNNLLTAIAGYAQLVITTEEVTPEIARDVGDIAEAASLAIALVRQLQTGA
jgi:two-component system cell cycle sensor histidine kinase/response regulator CckA